MQITDNQCDEILPRSTCEIKLRLTNNGNYMDEFSLSVEQSGNIQTALSKASFNLDKYEEMMLYNYFYTNKTLIILVELLAFILVNTNMY